MNIGILVGSSVWVCITTGRKLRVVLPRSIVICTVMAEATDVNGSAVIAIKGPIRWTV